MGNLCNVSLVLGEGLWEIRDCVEEVLGGGGALVEETSGLWFCFVSTRVPGLEENQLCQSSLIVEAIGRT